MKWKKKNRNILFKLYFFRNIILLGHNARWVFLFSHFLSNIFLIFLSVYQWNFLQFYFPCFSFSTFSEIFQYFHENTRILTYTFTLPVLPLNSVSQSLAHTSVWIWIHFFYIYNNLTQIETTKKFLSENSYNTKFSHIAWNTFSFFSPYIFYVRVSIYILSSTMNMFFRVKEFSFLSYCNMFFL